VNGRAMGGRGGIWRFASCALAGLVLVLTTGALTAQAAGSKKKRRRKPRPKPTVTEETGGGGGGGGNLGAADGFGRQATGGSREVRVSSASQLASALKRGGARVVLASGDYNCAFNQLVVKSNTTFDGGGATLWFPGTNHNGKGLAAYGSNIIIRNVHVRNSGDGILFGASSFKGTKNVLVERASVTGCGDDGFSVAYNCSDITIRWSIVSGCNRSVFFKYGGHNLTMHHNILSRAWIRNPLCSGSSATIDFRNNLVEHWKMWGTRTESGSKGNFVNNTWRFEKWAGGKSDAALFQMKGGIFYSSGNTYIGCKERSGSSRSPVVQAPRINGQTDARTALAAVLDERTGAGCMPRNAIDRAYLTIRQTARGGDGAVGLIVPEAQRGGSRRR